MLCNPGDPVELLLEPKNEFDANAVAVLTTQGGQMGYINADRAAWIAGMMRQGREVTAIFQAAWENGCYIRVGLDGAEPYLPASTAPAEPASTEEQDYCDNEINDFYADFIPPDD
jgi:HIRAN domain.